MSLYDKYGGFATINSIVTDFYDNLLENNDVAHFFENVSLERLIDHQTKFLCQVLGGPSEYTGKELSAAHQNMNISDADFGTVATILKQTLEDAGVEPEDLDTIIGIVASTKDQIVTKAA